MKPLLLLSLLALSACATPGAEDQLSNAAVIAMATGPKFVEVVDKLPPEAYSTYNHFNIKWYDRTRSVWLASDEAGHQAEITSAASGEMAVSDNKTRAAAGQAYGDLLLKALIQAAQQSATPIP